MILQYFHEQRLVAADEKSASVTSAACSTIHCVCTMACSAANQPFVMSHEGPRYFSHDSPSSFFFFFKTKTFSLSNHFFVGSCEHRAKYALRLPGINWFLNHQLRKTEEKQNSDSQHIGCCHS